jgi:hypothetical protein
MTRLPPIVSRCLVAACLIASAHQGTLSAAEPAAAETWLSGLGQK